jgi:hypothetical protein
LGTFLLQFEIERNGIKNSRRANVIVVKPFVPKTYVKKSIAYITVNGSIADVPWDDITHLIVSSAVVGADGLPDLTFGGRTTLDIPTLIATAHNYGVFVLLEYSGVLGSYLNAGPAYASYNFYSAAVSESHSSLITAMVDYAVSTGFDGIDVYMDKASEAGSWGAPEALRQFYEDLVTAAPATTERGDFLLTMTVVTGWTKSAFDNIVTTPGYDWLNVHAFNATDLQAMQHAPTWLTTDDCGYWEQKGVTPSQIVPVAPAFGIHFNADLTGITWGNWDSYATYRSYRDIMNQYPNTQNQDMVNDNGELYYNGLTTIAAKASLVLTKDYGGMALWSIESDSKDPAKSLMKRINTQLGN